MKNKKITWKEVVVLSILFLSISFYFAPIDIINILNFIEKIFGILAGGSIFVAVINYFYSKKQNEVNHVISQISFFRKEILPMSYNVFDCATNLDKDYKSCNISLETPTIDYIKKEFSENVRKQNELLQKDQKIYRLKTNLLDAMEEFSLMVLNSGTNKKEALNSIRPAFVMLSEDNAVLLLQHRLISTGNSIYSGILRLYSLWVKEVDRRSPEDRIKEFLNKK